MDKISDSEILRRKKISQTLKDKYRSGEIVYKPPMTGKKHSKETIKKMRISAKKRVKDGIALPKHPGFGENHHWWRGGKAMYESIHHWVVRQCGKPKKCDRCGTKKNQRYEWANISGFYKKDITDWERLCVSCHRKEDVNNPKRPMKIFTKNKKIVGKK